MQHDLTQVGYDSIVARCEEELLECLKQPPFVAKRNLQIGLAQARVQWRRSPFPKKLPLVSLKVHNKSQINFYNTSYRNDEVVSKVSLILPKDSIAKVEAVQPYKEYTTIRQSFPTTEYKELNYVPALYSLNIGWDEDEMLAALWNHYKDPVRNYDKIYCQENYKFQQNIVASFLRKVANLTTATNVLPEAQAEAFFNVTQQQLVNFLPRTQTSITQCPKQSPSVCRLCFSYNCLFHPVCIQKEERNDSKLSKGYEDRLQKGAAMKVFKDGHPCSKTCFLHVASSLTKPNDWTEAEDRQFNAAAKVLYYNPRAACLVALRISKSCSEVQNRLKYEDVIKEPIITESLAVSSRRKDISTTIAARPPFRPCDHAGPCTTTKHCSCLELQINCEKFCGCPPECERRWRGCNCVKCGQACPCVKALRECDADVCSCKAQQTLDPQNYGREETQCCQNVELQRGIGKKMNLGRSNFGSGGFGLFVGEPIKKDDFLGDYIGELINEEENNRRGSLYDFRNCSYLFNISETRNIDAFKAGNKLRFINHADSRLANCGPKLTLVSGSQRMKFMALKDISVGSELFFDYGKEFSEMTKNFQKPSYTAIALTPGRPHTVQFEELNASLKAHSLGTSKKTAPKASKTTENIASRQDDLDSSDDTSYESAETDHDDLQDLFSDDDEERFDDDEDGDLVEALKKEENSHVKSANNADMHKHKEMKSVTKRRERKQDINRSVNYQQVTNEKDELMAELEELQRAERLRHARELTRLHKENRPRHITARTKRLQKRKTDINYLVDSREIFVQEDSVMEDVEWLRKDKKSRTV